MCMQCMAGAMAVGASATGVRAWLVVRFGHLMTPTRKRTITGALLVGGVLAAGMVGPAP